MKHFIKSLIPPIVFDLYAFIKNKRYGWSGNYSSWEEAQSHSTGYNNNAVLEAVKKSSLKVKNGEAIYERDSVCFYEESFRWPVLACLLRVAALKEGSLNVLDFGGSLGSFYFQHRKFFEGLKSISWSVVEQEHFVECGRSEFENGELKFYLSCLECSKNENVDVVILSSVLQYLKSPYELLDEIANIKADFIIIDRTPFTSTDESFITIQKVPEDIFDATLPVNVLSEKSIELALESHGYQRNVTFSSDEARLDNLYFQGMFYRRKNK